MPLLGLPNELIRDISEYLESGRDINAVAQVNRRLYRLLDRYLYRYNVQQSGSSALLWAARRGQEATAQMSLREKANIQARNNDDEAPLLLAVEKEHRQVVVGRGVSRTGRYCLPRFHRMFALTHFPLRTSAFSIQYIGLSLP
jgi:ankyrin repeat protein